MNDISPRLDPAAIERVSGPAWDPLRPIFFAACDRLLAASPEATSQLTTIYVKFLRPANSVYAVMWIKTSKQIVIGLAHTEGECPPALVPPVAGHIYPGLTRYLILRHGSKVPDDFGNLATSAFRSE